MKEIIKLFFSGVLLIWLAFMAVACIAAAVTTFMLTLPTMTGLVAVVTFIWGLILTILGICLVCFLGVFHDKAVKDI